MPTSAVIGDDGEQCVVLRGEQLPIECKPVSAFKAESVIDEQRSRLSIRL